MMFLEIDNHIDVVLNGCLYHLVHKCLYYFAVIAVTNIEISKSRSDGDRKAYNLNIVLVHQVFYGLLVPE